MNNKPDRRNFDRFPIEFVMEVSTEDSEGKKYKDSALHRTGVRDKTPTL